MQTNMASPSHLDEDLLGLVAKETLMSGIFIE